MPAAEEDGTVEELLRIADELYGLPPDRFTAARDGYAKERKGTPLAARVKALKKPSTAAWVVDLLVRREGEQIEQVLAVGEALREAQQEMDATQLRELTAQRRQLTAALTTRARSLAREHGTRVTDAVAGQVEATLTAAMIDATAAQAVRSGLLVRALSSTGVEEVDAGAAVALPDALGFQATPVEDERPHRRGLHVVADPEPDRSAVERAETAVAEAEEALSTAAAEHEAAEEEVERLRARSLQVEAEMDELRRRLAELEETAQQVDENLTDAEEELSAADGVLAEARRTHQKAVAARERL